MNKFTQYPHINNIEDMPTIFNLPEVIVTEKVHGSSMRIGIVDGVLRIGGRKLEFTDLRPETKEGQGFISWVLDTGLDKRMLDAFGGCSVILYGEWHGSGTPQKGWPQIQKGIRYVQGNDFRVFDVRLNGKYIPHDDLPSTAEKVELKTMPVLYRGKPDNAVFDSLIDTMSRVGEENGIVDSENTIEGIVIRPPEMLWNEDKTPLMAKFKIGKWAERASAKRHPKIPKKKHVVLPGAEAFAKEFVTDTRLEHVLDEIRETGMTIEMKVMGEVMKRMGQDIKREGVQALIAAGLEWKDVSISVTKLTKTIFMRYLK